MHPGEAGRLAGAAGQAAVEMLLGFAGDGAALQRGLNQINPSARTIALIAQQLIRGANGGAKTAMHAGTQNRLGLLPVRAQQK